MGFIGAIEPNPKVSDLPWFRLADPDYVDYALYCDFFEKGKRSIRCSGLLWWFWECGGTIC